MLISELYNGNFFKEGRYAPEFDRYVIQQFETGSQVLQAQQLNAIGRVIGDGAKGKVFEIMVEDGGLSPSRVYYGDVQPNVVKTVAKTVFMGTNSEKVIMDKNQMKIHGTTEKDRQLKVALARLQNTFVYKLFNADVDVIDKTAAVLDNKNYDFDGWVKYFKVNSKQVNSTVFKIGDIINDNNLKLKTNYFLREIDSRVSVNGASADMIYTTRAGKNMLTALEAYRNDYRGEYKFSSNVNTWEGIPIVVVPEHSIPEEWKALGEFVLFVNQDAEAGCRIMVPSNGGLLETYNDVDKGFTVETPIDMTFAPILVNGKAASLCYLKMGE